MNDAATCTSPKTKISIWNELCSDLNLAPTFILPESLSEDESVLETKALLLWEDRDRCEKDIAPVLYKLCKKLNAQGKKGEGFRAWLVKYKKSPATAYRWIKKYAEPLGLELPYVAKAKPKATSSHLGQGASSPTSEMQTIYPVPGDIGSAKSLLHQFFEVAAPQVRSEWALELVNWIKSEFLTPDDSSLEELS